MSFENPTIESSEDEKEKVWEEGMKEIEETVDGLGHPIDENIRETVVASKLLGLETSSSCEGHVERGLPVPYIEIQAPDKPEERFIGEDEAFKKVAEKYNITIDEARRSKIDEAYWEAIRECSQNEETREYKKWNEENNKMMKKEEDLLGEFYKDREVEENIKLQIDKQVAGFRIHNGGEDYNSIIEGEQKFTETERQERAEKIKKYRAEMDNFTKFLKDKYFGD